ncbi:MAG: Cys-Gln thioester bond-forming surface protein [Bacilli bacterium]|nr:Cys-Gln thioester bond-forming surface protein [Bacilli bacterium]
MKNKKLFLDKQSSAYIILATMVIGFIGTMYLSFSTIGKSYAIPSSNNDLSDLKVINTNLEDLNTKGGCPGGPSDNSFSCKVGYFGRDTGLYSDYVVPTNRITSTINFIKYDLYCLDRTLDLAEGEYSDPKEVNGNYDVALTILEKTYPGNSDYRNVTEEQYFVTQHAIWYSLAKSGADTSSDASVYAQAIEIAASKNNDLAKQILAIYNEALGKSQVKNSMEIIGADNVTLTQTSDGKYLETSDLRVDAKVNTTSKFDGFTVNVGDSSVKVVDTNGNEKNQFQNGNTFRIQIPIADEKNADSIIANIKISGTFQEGKLYYYSYGSRNDIQRVLFVNNVYRSMPAEVTLNFVKISKQDITNGNELEGATLKVEKDSGDGTYSLVTSWISSTTPKYIFLQPGNYRLTEISAPEGYELSQEVINFTVGDDNKPIGTVVMKNTPYVTPPDTASNLPIYIYIIGALILISGSFVIYISVRPRKN